MTTVGLLGSRYTMTGSYFVGRLRDHYGLNVLVAEAEHQEASQPGRPAAERLAAPPTPNDPRTERAVSMSQEVRDG